MEPTVSSQLDVCRFFQHWRGGGSVWPVRVSFFRCDGGYRECVLFLMVEGGQTEWCICCSGRFPRSVRSRTQPGRAESSVAGFGVRIPSSEEGVGAGFAAREWVRARGSDSSPRNANMSRTGVRQGLQRLWPAVLQVSESPLAPLKGGNQRVMWPVPAGHLSGKPGRRGVFVKVIGYGLWVIEKGVRDNGGE